MRGSASALTKLLISISDVVFVGSLILIASWQPSEASEFSDRIKQLAVQRNAAELVPQPSASTGVSFVEEAKKLRLGRLISPDNPFRKSDPARAIDFLERALVQPGLHQINAGNLLAELLLDRRNSAEEVSRAIRLLESNATKGDASAKLALAALMAEGTVIAPDSARRRRLVDDALVAGEPSAALILADEATGDKQREEYTRRAVFMLRIRSRESASARRELARLYAAGAPGFPSSLAKAVELYREAIALNDLDSGPEIAVKLIATGVGSSRVDLQACKLEYSIVSPK